MILARSLKTLAVLCGIAAFLLARAAQGDEGKLVRMLPPEPLDDLRFSNDVWITTPESCGEDLHSCELQELEKVGGSRWYFRTSALGDEKEFDLTWFGDLIEKRPSGEAREVWSVSGDGALAVLGNPQIVRREAEIYLLVPILYKGTGAFRRDPFFRWKGDHWQQVETGSWWPALGLEPCYELRKGPFIDFEKLSLDMDLWLRDDGNASGSGGRLTVQFEVKDDRLAAATWELTRDADPDNGIAAAHCGTRRCRCGPCPKHLASQ